MSGFWNFIVENLDIYGSNFLLRYKKKDVYQTPFGAILGIISVIAFLSLAIFFLLDLFERSNFTVITSFDSQRMPIIDLSHVPIMISYGDILGQTIEYDPTLYTYNIMTIGYESVYDKNGVKSLKPIKHVISFEDCNLDIHFSPYQSHFKMYNMTKFKCITPGQNLTINGRYGDTLKGFKILVIYVNKCDKTKRPDCQPDAIIKKKLANSQLAINYLTYTIDHYNSSYPDQREIRSEAASLSTTIMKKYYYKISQTEYITDSGLVFEDKTTRNLFEYQTYFIDVEQDDSNNISGSPTIGFFSFNCYDYISVYQRTYIKAQAVIASIGGCINFIHIIGQILTMLFTQRIVTVDMINTMVIQDKYPKKRGYFHNNNAKNDTPHQAKNTINTNNNGNTITNQTNMASNNPMSISIFRTDQKKGNETTIMTPAQANIEKGKKFVLKFHEYILPYLFMKKNKNIAVLKHCENILHTWLSVDYLLPSIEKLKLMTGSPRDDTKHVSAMMYNQTKAEINSPLKSKCLLRDNNMTNNISSSYITPLRQQKLLDISKQSNIV